MAFCHRVSRAGEASQPSRGCSAAEIGVKNEGVGHSTSCMHGHSTPFAMVNVQKGRNERNEKLGAIVVISAQL